MKICFTILTIFLFTIKASCQNNEIIYLWPGQVPGETEPKQEPVQTPNKKGNVTRLTDVTNPALIVFEADNAEKNGVGIIICPGGGYSILAIDKEGYEVAEWFNKLGYTTFVLQYRVPQKQDGALNDIQRAIRIVRSRAGQWKLNPKKLGVMGFSAGGSLSARISTRFHEDTYPKTDKADKFSSRPDFSMLVYPAYLDKGENKTLTPELTITNKTPPMFIFGAADDSHANSALVMAGALRDAKVPVEVHLLPSGGHGYGLRKGNTAGETWPKFAEVWLRNLN